MTCQTDEYLQAFETACSYLAVKVRSSQEVQNKLLQKGFSANVVPQVLARLRELNYVDDRQFAVLLVRKRKTSRSRGRQLLQRELLDKGIDSSLIIEILDQEYPIEEEIELGKKLAVKKWEEVLRTSAKSPGQKIVGYLKRKGFSWEAIREVYQQMQFED